MITNTNYNLPLLSAYTYFVPGIVLSSLYRLIYLILTKSLQGRKEGRKEGRKKKKTKKEGEGKKEKKKEPECCFEGWDFNLFLWHCAKSSCFLTYF